MLNNNSTEINSINPEKILIPDSMFSKKNYNKLLKTYRAKRKKIFENWYNYTTRLGWLERVTVFQHKYFPMPLFLYDYFYRSNFMKVIFNYYGYHIWRYKYTTRGENHSDYWKSKESLYWHFWRQSDKNVFIKEIMKIPAVKECLQNREYVACELGFGLGKNYRNEWIHNNLKEYLAVDMNKYVCEYNEKYYSKVKNIKVINSSAEDFIKSDEKFEILIACGEVFAYIEPKSVDNIFQKLKEKGVKVVIILGEGCMTHDIVWPDGTREYNFKERLDKYGYAERNFYYDEHKSKVLKYLVVC
jgi:hypothetical protein